MEEQRGRRSGSMGLDPGHFVFEKNGFGQGASLRGCFWEDSRMGGMMSRLFWGGRLDPIFFWVLFHQDPNFFLSNPDP